MGEARRAIEARFGARYTMPKGRVFKTKTRNAQEAHEAIRPTSFDRDPEALADHLGRDEARLYRLIWQRAIASQMTAKELETTSIDLGDGPYELRASATRTVFDGFSRVYTEGQDDAADEAERTLPALTEGEVTTVTRGDPDPALHRAATALHRGHAHQVPRGARDRPAVDLRRDDLDDRRPGLRRGEGAPPAPGVRRRDRHRPARRSLRRVRRPRVHGANGGRARRGRDRAPRMGAGRARVLHAVPDARRHEDQGAPPVGLHDPPDRRGLLRGPPDGRPARPVRRVPRLLALSRAQGDPSLARKRGGARGDERRDAGGGKPGAPGRRRDMPEMRGIRRRRARREARSLRAVRGLLALSRLRLHPQAGPAAACAARVRGRVFQVQAGPPRDAPGASQRLAVLGLLRATRSATSLLRTSPSERSTTRTRARSPARPTAADCASPAAPRSSCRKGGSSERASAAARPIPKRWHAPAAAGDDRRPVAGREGRAPAVVRGPTAARAARRLPGRGDRPARRIGGR